MISRPWVWLLARFARLSTGLKLFLILGIFLLPLGLLAMLASISSARDNAAKQASEAQARVELKAQLIDAAMSRAVLTIRAASAGVAVADDRVCRATLERLAGRRELPGRFALFAGGYTARCATPGFTAGGWPLPTDQGRPAAVEISPDGQTLRFTLFNSWGGVEGVGEYKRSDITNLTDLPRKSADYDLFLEGGNGLMQLRRDFVGGAFDKGVVAEAPVLGERLTLTMRSNAEPIGAIEILMILLPVLMWIVAGIIGWAVVDWFLLRPLVKMQRAVTAYQPGDRHLDLPLVATPAKEIEELGRAFDRVTQTVAKHEADLEASIEGQRKLVREVHHRVKNNLQVVASLLNLHARGTKSEDVAAAYASIQRRVDALAVVHRNHYAELEENRGVAIRSLLSELGSNLRATAPKQAADMQIRLDVEPFYVTQDVAVSIAFLATEMVEFAMLCGGRAVAVIIEATESEHAARLTIESDALRGPVTCDPALFERFDRIVTGLSRQLRSAIDRDPERGRYVIQFGVVGRASR